MVLTEFHLMFEYNLDQIWEKDASEEKKKEDRERIKEIQKIEDELS